MSAALLINVSDEEVVRRLSGRRTCEENGHVFHLEFNPPKEEGVCDVDGSKLMIRDDDKPEVIEKRLATYHEKTKPLVEWYDDHNILQRIDGAAPPEDVAEHIRGLLATMRREDEMEM